MRDEKWNSVNLWSTLIVIITLNEKEEKQLVVSLGIKPGIEPGTSCFRDKHINYISTLMVFLKEFFNRLADNKKIEKLLSMQSG